MNWKPGIGIGVTNEIRFSEFLISQIQKNFLYSEKMLPISHYQMSVSKCLTKGLDGKKWRAWFQHHLWSCGQIFAGCFSRFTWFNYCWCDLGFIHTCNLLGIKYCVYKLFTLCNQKKGYANHLLPPANEVCEGNVFTGVCPSGGVSVHGCLCPGEGSLSRWSLPRGSLSSGVSVQGFFVRGGGSLSGRPPVR